MKIKQTIKSVGYTKDITSFTVNNVLSAGSPILSIFTNPYVIAVYLILIGAATLIFSSQAHTDLLELGGVILWRGFLLPIEVFLLLFEIIVNIVAFLLTLIWNVAIFLLVGIIQLGLQIGDIIIFFIALVIFVAVLLFFALIDIAALVIIGLWDLMIILFDGILTIIIDRVILGFVGIIFTLILGALKMIQEFTGWSGVIPASWFARSLDATIFTYDSTGFDIILFGFKTGLKTNFMGDLWLQTGHTFIMGTWENVIVETFNQIIQIRSYESYTETVNITEMAYQGGGLIIDPANWQLLSVQITDLITGFTLILPKDWNQGLLNFQFEFSHIYLRPYFYEALETIGFPTGLLEEHIGI